MIWASADGRTWVNVLDPIDGGNVAGVAAGPEGIVRIDNSREIVVWMSTDGRNWERVSGFGPTHSRNAESTLYELGVSSIVATDAGFVAAGAFGQVCLLRCEPGEVIIWTSPDGRSWSRLSSDERFASAGVFDIVAWKSCSSWAEHTTTSPRSGSPAQGNRAARQGEAHASGCAIAPPGATVLARHATGLHRRDAGRRRVGHLQRVATSPVNRSSASGA